jgi:hypothetical protein
MPQASTLPVPHSLLAIDWSGALAPASQRRSIQIARCSVPGSNRAVAIEVGGGRVRGEVEALLYELRAEPVVVGLDFSFSYPAWFLQQLGCDSAPAFWALAAAQGEQWLTQPHPHFWGRRTGLPAGHRAPTWLGYRRCELAAAHGNRLPLSSFQIGGAGAVGTGSLRGMPMLLRLRAAGWSVWPFDPPKLPMLVEMYPRLLTGPVVKCRAAARATYLAQPRFQQLPAAAVALAMASEDAFDALVSVCVMHEHRGEFAQLRQAVQTPDMLEGAIWRPGGSWGCS